VQQIPYLLNQQNFIKYLNLKNIYQKTAKIDNLSLEKEVMIQRSNIGVNPSKYKS
jgi:hypothetical protein